MRQFIFSLAFLFMLNPAYAGEISQAVNVEPHQAVVRVKGVVCSFCAYGTEKNVAKLKFVDPSLYGDGVLMDIHTQLITIVLDPTKAVDLKSLHKAIKDGGYDPVTVYLRFSGTLTKRDNQYILKNNTNGQIFELAGLEPHELSEGQTIDVQGHLDADNIFDMTENNPIKIIVDKIHKT
jgi:hypothetical protein